MVHLPWWEWLQSYLQGQLVRVTEFDMIDRGLIYPGLALHWLATQRHNETTHNALPDYTSLSLTSHVGKLRLWFLQLCLWLSLWWKYGPDNLDTKLCFIVQDKYIYWNLQPSWLASKMVKSQNKLNKRAIDSSTTADTTNYNLLITKRYMLAIIPICHMWATRSCLIFF